MKVGFTGTRTGMSSRQISQLNSILYRLATTYEIEELHHGDCLGGDYDAHIIAKEHNIPVWLHPPIKPDLRAYCEMKYGGVIGSCEPDEYLTRDRHIVDETDLLIGAPLGRGKSRRGGTWYTIEYAMIRQAPYITLYTNGDMDLSRKANNLFGKLIQGA